jgi:hypothetical protein
MKYYILLLLFLVSIPGYTQVGIGTTTPDSSSLLELSSTNSGFLLPRVNLLSATDITTIPSPAEGLMIYNLNSNCNLVSGLYVFDGSRWRRVSYADTQTFTRLIRDEIGVGNVTFSNINTTNFFGTFSSLFDDADNTGGASFHVFRAGTPTGDWGFGITLPNAYFITGLILDGRNDCCTDRIVNVLVRLYRCGNLIYSSSALSSANTGDNTISIPNVYADEIQLVVENGGDTGGPNGAVINFSELDVLATN